MKRILIFFAALMFAAISCAQVDTVNIGTSANSGDGESLRSAFLKVNDFMDMFNGAYQYHLTLAGNDALTLTTSASTNVTLPTTGTLIGSATYHPDNLTVSGTTVYGLESTDSLLFYTPVAMRDDATTIFPTIQSAAGDTSNYATPDKIGDLYIDTSAGKVYVSVAAARGGWRILNYLLPLFILWNFKRRRRK